MTRYYVIERGSLPAVRVRSLAEIPERGEARLHLRGMLDDVAIIAAAHGVKLAAVLSPDRHAPITAARRAVVGWLHAEGQCVSEIARLLDLHHTSVLYYLNAPAQRGHQGPRVPKDDHAATRKRKRVLGQRRANGKGR